MLPSPYKINAASSEKLATGRVLAAKAYQWCKTHPSEFQHIYAYVKYLQDVGTKGHLRDRVAIHCLNNGIKIGKPAFGHDYWAGISRYLVLKDPSLMGNPVTLHESAIDHVGLYPWGEFKEAEDED